ILNTVAYDPSVYLLSMPAMIHNEFQLYQSNPSGNYGGWKATSVGANNASAQSLLKQDYKEDCDLKEACGMAVKVLSKTMDSTKLSSEKSNFESHAVRVFGY